MTADRRGWSGWTIPPEIQRRIDVACKAALVAFAIASFAIWIPA